MGKRDRSFGQKAAGFGKYFGAAYGDLVIDNFMTEAVFPTLLHQDPRYFRRGTGSRWSRLRYALGQTVWTHHDSSTLQFNYSAIVGSVAAVAISNAYYADNRTAVMPLPGAAFKSASMPPEISSKSFGRIRSESSIVAKDEIHGDEISEVDERRHRTNCCFWRATLRKHS